jgi:formamidopyrimidine-DNA glycosylase
MIELPEATTIAQQINNNLTGKHIADGSRGNSPHKFAFYNHTPEEYAEIFRGKAIGTASVNGSFILVPIEPEYTLLLGCGGEHIVYHTSAATLPVKHQLFLHFGDDTYLTVTVQGWGSALLLRQTEVPNHPYIHMNRPTPLSEDFTPEYFSKLFSALEPGDKGSMKYFLITRPGVLGIGNGCLQDILWHARLHPRRRAVDLTSAEQQALYSAIRETLRQMVEQGGRDGDCDLFDQPGGYHRILYSKSVGKPCPACGTPIEKAAYLGGAIYFCPCCQKM